MTGNSEILAFIREFSKFGKPVVTAFTQGNCYWCPHPAHKVPGLGDSDASGGGTLRDQDRRKTL